MIQIKSLRAAMLYKKCARRNQRLPHDLKDFPTFTHLTSPLCIQTLQMQSQHYFATCVTETLDGQELFHRVSGHHWCHVYFGSSKYVPFGSDALVSLW